MSCSQIIYFILNMNPSKNRTNLNSCLGISGRVFIFTYLIIYLMSNDFLLTNLQGDIPETGEVNVLQTKDGIHLRVATWQPVESIPRKGTILLFHGYTEFIEKYYEVIEELRNRGFHVVTADWRGQGLSSTLLPDTKKGYVNTFTDYIQDSDLIFRRMVAGQLPGPYYLLGHSMGGHLAIRTTQQYPDRFEKIIACSPMLGFHGLGLGTVKGVSSFFTNLGFGKAFPPGARSVDMSESQGYLTSNEVRRKRWLVYWEGEPGLVKAGPTWRWIKEASRSTQGLMKSKRIKAIKTPILLASAGKDRVVSPRYHKTFAKKSSLVELVEFPKAKHEILMETEGIYRHFWDRFDSFI